MSGDPARDLKDRGWKKVYVTRNHWVIVYDGVYEPSDDTWLLLETIDHRISRDSDVIDVCCGCGILGLYATKFLGVRRVVLIDLSDLASENSRFNAREWGLSYKTLVIQADGLSPIAPRRADHIICNPPYLPSREVVFTDVDAGHRGHEILCRIVRESAKILRRGGSLHIVFSSLTGEHDVMECLEESGFKIINIARKHYFFEDIIALEAVLVDER